MKPVSPVFVFSVSVGTLDELTSTSDKYASSATTIKFSALDYDALQRLTSPLCIAANDFIRRTNIKYIFPLRVSAKRLVNIAFTCFFFLNSRNFTYR